MALRIHAICLALNEEIFIENQLRTLYPFCSGISILSHYDRDWYSNPVAPDRTIEAVLNFPDPEGKIHLVVRRWLDEAAARNAEMLSFGTKAARGISPHSHPLADVQRFHQAPDYFLIVDADEVYDIDTVPRILSYLESKRPRGMRVLGYNYIRTWNRRVPKEVVRFCHFGFVRPGILFEDRRWASWNESRLSKVLRTLRLPDFSAKAWGFIECPEEVGFFHHGCWLGNDRRLRSKMSRSSHRRDLGSTRPEQIVSRVDAIETIYVPTEELPRNIREGTWPEGFFADLQI